MTQPISKTDIIKPCPFCGGEAALRTLNAEDYYLFCTGCSVSSRYGRKNVVVAYWNRRAPVQVTDEMCAAATAVQQGINLKTHPRWADVEIWGQHRISAMRAALEAVLGGEG